MLFLLALFLFPGVLCGASVVESVPTYEYRDRITREILTCDQCPPGTHKAAHCTATTPTQCVPCRSDHFTELWNYLPRCLYCNILCSENQEVETECSSVSNRVCRCKEGFYWTNDFCIRHTDCGPGHGVKRRGTSQTNTVCEKCSNGYFSSSSSALETCVKHQECAYGQIVLLPGSVYSDTMCGFCEDIANGGEALRTFLWGFFNMHRMRVVKMKKLVTRYIQKSVPRQRGPLLEKINVWLAQAPEKDLRQLPNMLKSSDLHSMADKLKKTFKEIEQQSPNCSLNL